MGSWQGGRWYLEALSATPVRSWGQGCTLTAQSLAPDLAFICSKTGSLPIPKVMSTHSAPVLYIAGSRTPEFGMGGAWTQVIHAGLCDATERGLYRLVVHQVYIRPELVLAWRELMGAVVMPMD
jgi:hypothetical protein